MIFNENKAKKLYVIDNEISINLNIKIIKRVQKQFYI
jgi:hypothetical protein